MSHLTEEQLNLYLDKELSRVERASVEAHLAGCDTCRAELASLQTLFTALDALQPESLTDNLASLVLREIAAEREQALRRRRIGWLIPALQGVAVALLLVFGWSALATRYDKLIQRIPVEAVTTSWAKTLAQGEILWAATAARWQAWGAEVLTLPAALGQAISTWPQLPGLRLSVPQLIAVSLAAALMWLVGNSILLRPASARLRPSRHSNHQ